MASLLRPVRGVRTSCRCKIGWLHPSRTRSTQPTAGSVSKTAVVPMSGLGEPERTARPMPLRAKSARDPAATALVRLSLIARAMASDVRITTSNFAPVSIFCMSAAVELYSIERGWPMVRSHRGCSSSTTAFMPLDASTRTASACCDHADCAIKQASCGGEQTDARRVIGPFSTVSPPKSSPSPKGRSTNASTRSIPHK